MCAELSPQFRPKLMFFLREHGMDFVEDEELARAMMQSFLMDCSTLSDQDLNIVHECAPICELL